EEEGPRGPGPRAVGGGARRPRGGGHPRLLQRGAQRPDRRRAASPGGVGPEAARPTAGDRPEPRPGRGKRGAPVRLRRRGRRIQRGLEATAPLWPAIRLAFAWVHLAARILGTEGIDAATAQKRLGGLLGAMARHQNKVGGLASAVGHFLKVSRSYWPGLFHCYRVNDLPRTNNALEQQFGSYRHHERRGSGGKGGPPAFVLPGAAPLP